MAKEWANDTTTRTDTQYCDYPENITVIPELCGRHDHTPVDDLAADIEAHGQLEACVCRAGDNDEPILVFGHRRYRAIALLNERNPAKKRKVLFRYQKLSAAESFALAIGENRFRKEVTPMDDSTNMATAMRLFNWSETDLAKTYFPEAATEAEKTAALRFVKQRLSLQELAPEAATAVREGRIKITAAVELSKLTKNQQREKVAAPGKIKGSDVRGPKPEKLPTPPASPSEQQSGIPSTAKPEFFYLAVKFIRAYLSDPQELTPSDLDKLGLDALHAAGLKA